MSGPWCLRVRRRGRLALSPRTRKKSKARYYKCGQAPGLKNKRIFLSDAPPNKCISPDFCFLSLRSRGNWNKDSISLWAGRQLLRGIYGLAAVRPPGRARRGTGC